MKSILNFKLAALIVLSPGLLCAQDTTIPETSSVFSNPLFLVLLSVIIVLLIAIVAFSSAFKNLADSEFLVDKYKDKKTTVNKTLLFILSFLTVTNAYSQSTSVSNSGVGGLDTFTFYFMLSIIFMELLFLGVLLYQFSYLVKTQKANAEKTSIKVAETKLIKSLTDAVPVEEEDRILLDHDYDGIKELDNNLPPWWKYGFYLTIVFAFIYLISYHVVGIGSLQEKEYNTEMLIAKQEVDEFMKNSANNVDENTVKLLTQADDLAKGKDLFITNCGTCHGKLGEGSVGPNLTDAYWLHGGSLREIFKTIKYGWVEKGMKAWKEDLSPVQIAQITSFIKSIVGTNPPKAKAPQGDLYTEASVTTISDSLNKTTGSDTLKVKLPADTIPK